MEDQTKHSFQSPSQVPPKLKKYRENSIKNFGSWKQNRLMVTDLDPRNVNPRHVWENWKTAQFILQCLQNKYMGSGGKKNFWNLKLESLG